MEVTGIKFLRVEKSPEFVTITLELSVTSGTYIRTLAEEFGRMLGYPATTAALRRIIIGEYNVADAKKIAGE